MSEAIAVIGTGPAGVTAARRLQEAGLAFTLIDAGFNAETAPRTDRPALADLRYGSPQAWHYLIGDDYRGLRFMPSVSPKLRLAQSPEEYTAFTELNRIDARNFIPVGCLATGGLSNIWGAVAFAYDDSDMAGWPVGLDRMAEHYRRVSARMGLSGPPVTDLDRSATPLVLQDSLPVAPIEAMIFANYARKSKRPGFRIGQTRMAVLSTDRNGRLACALDNACLWGCERGAIYNATHDAAELARHSKTTMLQGFVVEKLTRHADGWWIDGHDRRSGERKRVSATKVVLAAGALASTRLALDAAGINGISVRIEDSPQIAFAALFPAALGSKIPAKAFGLAQIAFSRSLDSNDPADEMLGFLYPAYSMSAAELLPRMPLSIPGGMAVLRDMLPGLMIGLAFMPGRYGDSHARLAPGPAGLARLQIEGGHSPAFPAVLKRAVRKLRWDLLRLGGVMLPGSLQVFEPGASVHYSGSLAMGRHSDTLGQVTGAPGLHVVDGAVLPSMPARNPTVTIMANADRIGAEIARAWAGRQ